MKTRELTEWKGNALELGFVGNRIMLKVRIKFKFIFKVRVVVGNLKSELCSLQIRMKYNLVRAEIGKLKIELKNDFSV